MCSNLLPGLYFLSERTAKSVAAREPQEPPITMLWMRHAKDSGLPGSRANATWPQNIDGWRSGTKGQPSKWGVTNLLYTSCYAPSPETHMRVMTHKSREFQRVTSQMHVVSVHIRENKRAPLRPSGMGCQGPTPRVSPGTGAKWGIH